MEFNNSRLQQYLTCPRSFKHRYLMKMVSKKKPTYFVLGEAIHKFIEFYYRTKDKTMALKQIDNVFKTVKTELLNREEMHDLECDKSIAYGIAEAYPTFYKADFDEFKTFLTEQTFKIPLPNSSHTYYGTLDALLQDHAGDWWILETKTAAAQSLNDDYFERVKIDSQVSGYMHGGKHIIGVYPRGVIYNVIKKPAIRLKNGESLQAFQQRVRQEYISFAKEKNYFQRQQLVVSTHRLETWAEDTSRLVNFVADKIATKDKHWHMNTGACRANYGSCTYMNACITNQYNSLMYEKDTSGK